MTDDVCDFDRAIVTERNQFQVLNQPKEPSSTDVSRVVDGMSVAIQDLLQALDGCPDLPGGYLEPTKKPIPTMFGDPDSTEQHRSDEGIHVTT